ncbi:putative polyketide biosynthesis enoyl-CoA isomerase PksI [Nocardiopsis terrae]|uniref:Polyketide biosynthesis enoyl-CoA hydratase PksI n=1 Tax=Nocardiopsis terrae TaxID=372655 RepID=A0ABR9HD08_9ACTN|nr:polyketide synthase [Nocardiopsis terrae]MBE1456916.1 polyketide biosynthesis enoyl-CoA hydratase PksI [Nocardiopsis terrae]GHC74409.1 putative polyketide biosynthesis enoyl-CoA isomerase PksI [Nocardiopsis terrae]
MRTPVGLDIDGSVATVQLRDSAGRNSFSPRLCGDLVDAVDRAVATEHVRTLLVTGLPELFCSGGTKEELLRFARGEGRFDTDDFFRVFARCPLPVVAAVRGHAIGGGLVMALYADLVVLSERSVYAANFMRYGFTPGMGATHLLPARLGHELGVEMLYTARNYRGAELRARGVPLRVEPHDRVEPAAEELARSVAQAPRTSLELLKRELAAARMNSTTAAIDSEARMHETAFRLPEVRERILGRYGPSPHLAAAHPRTTLEK